MTGPEKYGKELFDKFYKALFLCETTKQLGIDCTLIALTELLNEAKTNERLIFFSDAIKFVAKI